MTRLLQRLGSDTLWRQSLTTSVSVAVAVALLGCSAQLKSDPADDVVKKSDQLYQAYLEGNRDQAKQSLKETIQLVENAKLQPLGQANCLLFTFARLYVIEKRTGSDALAEAYLAKARYWYLREHELSGDSADQASAALKSFTAQKCMEFVDQWDNDHTDGRGPSYLRQQ